MKPKRRPQSGRRFAYAAEGTVHGISMSTTLDAPVEEVWDAVRDPEVLRAIARPIFTIDPLDPPAFPKRWVSGDYRARLRLFGVIPFGWQVIGPRYPDAPPPGRMLVDIGRSPLFRQWEHRILLVPDGARTLMTDRLSFDAGGLTHPAGLVLRLFFLHRHRRLRRWLARRR